MSLACIMKVWQHATSLWQQDGGTSTSKAECHHHESLEWDVYSRLYTLRPNMVEMMQSFAKLIGVHSCLCWPCFVLSQLVELGPQ
eukprot:6467668-Amphidinium_carterae.4